MKKVALFTVSIFLMCTTIACTKNVKMVDYKESSLEMKSNNYEVVSKSEGLSSCFNLLYFIPFSPEPNFVKAEENAIAKEAGDNLIDVSYYEETIFTIFGSIKGYYVKGKAIKYK